MLPCIVAALLALAGPAFAQGSGSTGADTTGASRPTAVPGTGGVAIVPGTSGERGAGASNPGSAAAPGTTPPRGSTSPLPSKDVTTGGSASGSR